MNVSVKFNVTEDNGAAFFSNSVDYSNMSRSDVVALEAVLLQTFKTLHELGAQKASAKK